MSASGVSSIAAVLLAAGSSKRFGKSNKLLETIDGEPLVRKTANTILRAGVKELRVVTGHESDQVGQALEGMPCELIVNPRFQEGMGSSLACGVASLRGLVLTGVLVCLADLPELDSDDVHSVMSAFLLNDSSQIVVPVFEGKRGHPVCFPKRCQDDLEKLAGDRGARGVIESDSKPLVLVERSRRGCIYDLDTKKNG